MNAKQKTALIEALESNNPTKAVTVCLQICATLAKEGRQSEALGIKYLIDRHVRISDLERHYYRKLLEITTRLVACDNGRDIDSAFKVAAQLIERASTCPLPDGIDERMRQLL